MADFNFFLNRQGVRGNKGEQGEQGYSPRITVKTETASEYVLNVQNEDGSYDTPNLRGNAIENLGGTYVRFNQDTEQMYTGYADTASTTSQGEVTLSTYEDLASGGDESEVTTSKDVHDFVEAKISEASVNYVDIDDYTQKMSELDGEISDLDNNKLDFTGLANTLAAGTNITITPNTSTGKITIAGEPVSQAQADWNQTDTDAPDYIKNKPAIPEAVTIDSELSSTSTNPVQNRLVTNAINLISNEFENYATNKLDNLSNEGESRLHALKAYSDNGEVLTDAEGLADVTKYAHSTFDSSKFTVTGSPVITSDGIASGFSSSNYLKVNGITLGSLQNKSFEIKIKFKVGEKSQAIWYPNIDWGNTRLGVEYIHETSYKEFRFYSQFGSKSEGISVYQNARDGVNGSNINVGDIYELAYKFDYPNNLTFSICKEGTNNIISVNRTAPEGFTDVGLYAINHYPNGLLGLYPTNNNTQPQDLKQFSITVDGVEVFSGNKTGIDTIKPDDYTVTGSPTITTDGVASGFTNNDYIIPPNLSMFSTSITDFDFYIPFNISSIPTSALQQMVRGQSGSTFKFLFKIDTDGTIRYNFSTLGGQRTILPATNLKLNTNYIAKISLHNGTMEAGYIENGVYTSGSVTNNIASIDAMDLFRIGGGTSNYFANGSIDLNGIRFYINGDLVYQPCLKIPYTQSKTGSKIVNATYRDRVNDMAEQFGYANYYTLDEDNGTFTLPRVELYGLIEKAASTVPSGVVQSSTIRNIVSLTQAEYDALVTKDSNTFYVIIPST